jgi:peptide-methionine (R)-S-oxide reductase
MIKPGKLDFEKWANVHGSFVCSNCSSLLFEANKKFEAGCGFPSFWMHFDDNVKLNPLITYGRNRVQLLCNTCGQHLGHLFDNKFTPTKVRYCINENAIEYNASGPA